MKKLLTKGFVLFLTIALLGGVLAGCGGSSKDSGASKQNEKGTVNLAYVNWAEGVAMTNLAKVVLEEKMGYDVKLTMADAAPVFTSLASGDQDVFLDAWLPITHESYMEEYGDDLEDLGYNFEGAKIGLVVPSYMKINSIEDLNDNAKQLDGQIIGIDSGAGIMKKTEEAVDTYNLNLDLIAGSGPAMTAGLSAAIEDKEPIVVTGWTPHWKFARWDLKFLEDQKGVYGKAENIHTIARKGFSEDMPEVAEFLKNFYLDNQQLGDLMGAISDSKEDPDVVAKAWMEKNEDLIQSWIPEK